MKDSIFSELKKLLKTLETYNVSLKTFMIVAYAIVTDNDCYDGVSCIKHISGKSQNIVKISMNDSSFSKYLKELQTCIDTDNLKTDENECNAIIIENNELPFDDYCNTLGLIYCSNEKELSFQFFDKNNVYQDFEQIMAERLKKVCSLFINDPLIRMKEIDIISDYEYGLMSKYAVGEKSPIATLPFHTQFQEVAAKHASKIAVICGNDKITFKELNEKSNRISHYIQNNIKCKNKLIGVFLDRSIDYIASILAIVKSGNAYVPIDPDTLSPGHNGFPKKRLEFMLKDAQVPLVITSGKYEEYFNDLEVLWMNVESIELNKYSIENQDILVTDSDIMYGIYTSGSSGTPKLTLVEHKSVNNLYNSLNKYVFSNTDQIKSHNTVLSVNAPFGFDASVQQIVGLINGYSLCILPENIRNSVNNIIKYINDKKITVFDCTPTQLWLLLENGILSKCLSLEAILVGGEAIPDKMWEILRNEHRINIYNVYGPTECTVDSTIYCINGTSHDTPVIGRPIDNNSIFILDDKLRPVPLGKKGVLYIAGPSVSRGYFNREDLTAKVFLTINNLSPVEKNFYCTGDVGKYLYDGSIQYIGRIDSQVKLRSHRIELSEVRSVLNKCENIKDSIVLVKDEAGYQTLIAYVIPVADEVEEDRLRDFLSQYLPYYMVPNHFVPIQAWPTTKNNKIDISKLPEVSFSSAEKEIASLDDLEKDVAEIMAQILNINQMRLSDNFMALGGDSLRVMTLLAKIYAKYHKEIDFTEFFETPTIGFISNKIRNI